MMNFITKFIIHRSSFIIILIAEDETDLETHIFIILIAQNEFFIRT